MGFKAYCLKKKKKEFRMTFLNRTEENNKVIISFAWWVLHHTQHCSSKGDAGFTEGMLFVFILFIYFFNKGDAIPLQFEPWSWPYNTESSGFCVIRETIHIPKLLHIEKHRFEYEPVIKLYSTYISLENKPRTNPDWQISETQKMYSTEFK